MLMRLVFLVCSWFPTMYCHLPYGCNFDKLHKLQLSIVLWRDKRGEGGNEMKTHNFENREQEEQQGQQAEYVLTV